VRDLPGGADRSMRAAQMRTARSAWCDWNTVE
jgi:hypothetical protein